MCLLFTRHWWLFSIVILSMSAGWIFISRTDAEHLGNSRISSPYKGFLAPDFTLLDSNGETVTLSNLSGQPAVINFWATWCPPCKAEMPAMQNVFQDYEDHGLVILAINSTSQDDPNEVASFIEEHRLTFPVLLDQQGRVSDLYKIRALPTSLFIGKDGIIQEVVIGGPIAEALLRILVERMLQ